jgi:hypothetical protein
MPAVTLARIDSKPAVGRGLFGLSQSVNATNYPDAPAQLLALDEKTGDITVIGPILDGDTPLYFDSVTGWPFYAGGHASDGRTFAVLERPDRTPVLATVDLATGKGTSSSREKIFIYYFCSSRSNQDASLGGRSRDLWAVLDRRG